MSDFLNAKSMLTPGIAGGLVMLLTDALASQFGAAPNWTALVLSALVGLLVLGDTKVPVVQRAVFYVLNALIIFAVAVGTNQLGAAATGEATPVTRSTQQSQADDGFFRPWFE
jgi:hypothetical protein